MSKRYPGGLLSTTGVREPSATDQTKNSGIWTLEEQYQAETSQTWANPTGQVYEIPNSLRFKSESSAYFNRTPFPNDGSRKTFTFSTWLKLGLIDANERTIFSSDDDNTAAGNFFTIAIWQNQLRIVEYASGYRINLIPTQVMRDPSAWYHLVVAVDTTQLTTTDRVKIFLNGSQITSFGTATYPNQNTDLYINLTSKRTAVGARSQGGGAVYFFDGYLAEVNFVDGLSLDPTQFGYFDYNNVWQPKKYSGARGPNGFYLTFKDYLNSSTNIGSDRKTDTQQQISCGSNASLTNSTSKWGRTSFNMGNFCYQAGGGGYGVNWGMHNIYNKNFTFEFWYKGTAGQTNFATSQDGGVLTGYNYLVGKGRTNSAFYGWGLQLDSNGAIGLDEFFGGSSAGLYTTGANVLDDNWHHIAVTRSGSTTRIYVDGIQRASGTLNNNTDNGYGLSINGMWDYTNGNYITYKCGGAMDDFRMYTGITKYTGNFTPPTQALPIGEEDPFWGYVSAAIPFEGDNGQTVFPYWVQHMYSANNITIGGGIAGDQTIDSPTSGSSIQDTGGGGQVSSNYCTLNPLTPGFVNTTRRCNLQAYISSGGNAYYSSVGTIPITSGKWYWECYPQRDLGAGQWTQVGIINAGTNYANAPIGFSGNMSSAYAYYNDGFKAGIGTTSAYGATYTNGDTIGVAFDADAGTLTFYKNGVSQGVAFTGISNTIAWLPIGQIYRSNSTFQVIDFNFGLYSFNYAAPAGFKTLNTASLPMPAVPNGKKHFDSVLYRGNATEREITPYDFSPGLLWIKRRDAVENNQLSDAVRGAPTTIFSNATNGDTNYATNITGFTGNGFTLGTDSNTNVSGGSFVAWSWNAKSTPSSTVVINSTGTIGSNVLANPTAGFSVITYVGNGTAGATVGHGLSSAPRMIIFKRRTVQNWSVYHASLGPANYLWLNNSTGQSATDTTWLNNTNPSSTVITLGTNSDVNVNADTYVAYCFAEIPGYSRFASYTGNGSSDGVFVYTGFRPKYVLIKQTNAAEDWAILDSSRNPTNPVSLELWPNSNAAEYSGGANTDFLSNGFKFRSARGNMNTNANTYIYAAFAEHPFNLARAK